MFAFLHFRFLKNFERISRKTAPIICGFKEKAVSLWLKNVECHKKKL
jgi:hypothetical protein